MSHKLTISDLQGARGNILYLTPEVAFSRLISLRLGLMPIKKVNSWEKAHNIKTYNSIQDFAYTYCYNYFTETERLKILHYTNFFTETKEENTEWYNLINKMDTTLNEFLENH